MSALDDTEQCPSSERDADGDDDGAASAARFDGAEVDDEGTTLKPSARLEDDDDGSLANASRLEAS